MTNKILVLQGLPGSGKSTYAKELMTKEPGVWKRVNKDLFRIMLDNGVWNDKNEKFILDVRDFIIVKSLNQGYNVILDDCNLAPKHVKQMEKLAGMTLSDLEIKFIDTPLKECIERDSKRGEQSVGKKVIIDMYNRYLRKEVIMDQDELSPHAFIFDVDGTISTNDGQRGFYEWDKVYLDVPNNFVCNVLKSLKNNYKIIILSGRDGSCYDMTKKWLEDNGIPFDLMLMRKAGDMRPDEVIKKEIFDEFIKEKYYIEAVVDDRPKVCNMWREIGLKTLQVGDPDFEF